jgi:protein-tyrosine kinase
MTRLADALLRASRQNQVAAAGAAAVATPEPEPAREPSAPIAAPVAAMRASTPPVAAAPVAVAATTAVLVAPAPAVSAPEVAAPAPRPALVVPAAPSAPAAPTPARVESAPAAEVAPGSAAKAAAPPVAAVDEKASTARPAAAAPRRATAFPRAAAIEKPIAGSMPGGSSLLAVPTSADQLTLWRSDPETTGKLVGTEGFLPSAMEQYRKLAAILHHAQVERGLKVIMTSSAMPGEGKSLTSVNLALTLSDSYRKRVLLVDVDLRRPTVQRIFGLPPVGGLTEALTGAEDRPIAITRVSESLFVLPAGRPEADPMSGLTSDRMKRVLAQAASQFDWVIVDSPPVGLLPDASLLATLVDGVLLVIRSGKAPFTLVKRAVEIVTHQRILGVVMNAIDFKHDRNAGGYYEYYGAGYYGAGTK